MRTRSLSLVPCLALLPIAALLSGCAMTDTTAATPSSIANTLFVQGNVHGGQQPVVGAHVYLYQAGTTAYGGPGIAPATNNASISKLGLVAGSTLPDLNGNYYTTTSSTGQFTLTGDYTCTAGTQLYIYAVGGYQGAATNTNSAAAFMGTLGTCPGTAGSTGNTFSSSTYVYMNELTTVATAYALAGFASDATHISTSGSALGATGLANAFATAANLVNMSTGQFYGNGSGTGNSGAGAVQGSGNGTIQIYLVNTLANILASCVNSYPNTSGQCTNLFANAKFASGSGTTPTDTATAAINIAHNPGVGVTNLFGLASASGPFLPALPKAPNDFMIGIVFPGASTASTGGADGAYSVAIDASSNVWLANIGNSTITELSVLGKSLSGTGFATADQDTPIGIAIDTTGDAWAAQAISSNLVEVTPSGTVAGPYPTTANGGGIHTPEGIAIDGLSDIWVPNIATNSISRFSNSGTPISPAGGYVGGNLNQPKSIAIDSAEHVWVGNGNGNPATSPSTGSLSLFTQAGVALSTSQIIGGGLNNPVALAIDSANDCWVANGSGNTLSEFTSGGTPISPSVGYANGGLNLPSGLSIDGNGNIWVANQGNSTISEFQGSTTPSTYYAAGSAISPVTGLGPSYVFSPQSLAVDGSGNVWVANTGSTTSTTSTTDSTVTEFIGAATPVVTPLSVAVLNGKLGTRP